MFPSLTVEENLRIGGLPGRDGRWSLDTVYELFPRLRERRGHYGGQLSGGEQQMVAIGRALMANPVLLLMDEPSEGLAPLIVRELERTMSRLKETGLAIVLVEQNLPLALAVADTRVHHQQRTRRLRRRSERYPHRRRGSHQVPGDLAQLVPPTEGPSR